MKIDGDTEGSIHMKRKWSAVFMGLGLAACLLTSGTWSLDVQAEEMQEKETDSAIVQSVDIEGNVYEEPAETGWVEQEDDGIESYSNDIKLVNFNTKGNKVTNFVNLENGKQGYTNGAYGADAAYLGTSNNKVRFVLSGVAGEVDQAEVQLVSISKAKSISHYAVSAGNLIHKVSYNLDSEQYRNWKCGKAPQYLQEGKSYYSYDGKYFYEDYNTMLTDYQNGNRNASINSGNPYYNYYQYLSLKSVSKYDARALDNILEQKILVSSSKMLGLGKCFVETQNTQDVNALLMTGLAANESAWGTSKICQEKTICLALKHMILRLEKVRKYSEVQRSV